MREAPVQEFDLWSDGEQRERNLIAVQNHGNWFQLKVEIYRDEREARPPPCQKFVDLGERARRPHASAAKLLEQAFQRQRQYGFRLDDERPAFFRERHKLGHGTAIVRSNWKAGPTGLRWLKLSQ